MTCKCGVDFKFMTTQIGFPIVAQIAAPTRSSTPMSTDRQDHILAAHRCGRDLSVYDDIIWPRGRFNARGTYSKRLLIPSEFF